MRAAEDSLLHSRSDVLRAALVRLLFLTRHFLSVNGRRWKSCPPPNQRGLSRKSKSSHRTVPPLGKHSSVCVCVCTVGSADTQGQTQFADGSTPSEKKRRKKKNTQALLDARGPEGVGAPLQAKENNGGGHRRSWSSPRNASAPEERLTVTDC